MNIHVYINWGFRSQHKVCALDLFLDKALIKIWIVTIKLGITTRNQIPMGQFPSKLELLNEAKGIQTLISDFIFTKRFAICFEKQVLDLFFRRLESCRISNTIRGKDCEWKRNKMGYKRDSSQSLVL